MATTKEKTADKSVLIYIPEDPDDKMNTLLVSVNGRVWKLMRGKTTKVPREVAEVIVNSQEATSNKNKRIQILVAEAEAKAAKAGL